MTNMQYQGQRLSLERKCCTESEYNANQGRNLLAYIDIIERVKQFNFLGIILHYTLKWQKHIDYISKKKYLRQSVLCTDLNIYIQKQCY